MAQIYIAELVVYDPSIPGTTTLYFASQGYVTKTTDTPASTYYDGRIQQPANVQRSAFDGAATYGETRVGYGELVLANNDGSLDGLIAYGFDGRAITIKLGIVTPSDGGVPTWTTVLKGTMEQPEFSWDKVTIAVRDRQFEIDIPIQRNKYGGTNSLPNGLDGVATDLKGKPKPKLYGTAYNMDLPFVNTSRLIYQISDSLVTSVGAVYDRGAALTTGTLRSLALMNLGSQPFTFTVDTGTDVATTSTNTYTTGDPVTVTTTTTLPAPLAINTIYYWRALSTTTGTFHTTSAGAVANTGKVDLTTTGTGTHTVDNNVTLAGRYDWALDATGSYIRLGTTPAGLITCDATQGAAASNRTVAQVLKQMLLDAGISSGDILAGDVTALDTANSAEVGYWASSAGEISFIEAMDEIANSIGSYYGVDRTGIFRMGAIVAPTGTAVATLTTLEIVKIDRIASQDPGKGVPTFKVNLDYKKYEVIQDSDLAGAVTAVTRAQLAEQYRRVNDTDTSVQTAHLLSPEMTFQTRLIDATAAQTEATRRLTLYKTRRDRVEARVYLDATLAAALDLGVIVTVTMARFGYDAGKKFIVIGIRTDLRNGMVDLTLWG